MLWDAKNSHMVGLGIVLFVAAVDQGSKFWASQSHGMQINTGVSLGLLQQNESIKIIAIVASMCVAAWIGWQYWSKSPIAAGLFFGGGVSNLLDHIVLGGVRDWMPVPIFAVTNNLADWAIAVGSVILVWQVIYTQQQEKGAHASH